MHFNTLLPEHRWVSSGNQPNRWYPVQNCLVSPKGWGMLRTSVFLTSWFRPSFKRILNQGSLRWHAGGNWVINGTGQRKSSYYFLYWMNAYDSHGFIKYIGKLLQVTGFFLKATFCIPASFMSGIQVSFCVCTLIRIFPAMAPLVCEQVDDSVHVSASTRWTQNGSAHSLMVVLNVSSTGKTEEVHAFHKFTSEQTQALTLTHSLLNLEQSCCQVSWWLSCPSFCAFSDCCWLSYLQLVFLMPAKQCSPTCYRSALATRKPKMCWWGSGIWVLRKGMQCHWGHWALPLLGWGVGGHQGQSKTWKQGDWKAVALFFPLLSSISASVHCMYLEDVAENHQVCDLLSKGGHMQDISWALALAQSSCWLVDSTEKGFLRSPTQP